MTLLLIGLTLFFAAHSIRIVADPWRTRQRARLGELRWRGLYSLVSLTGLVMLIWGYGRIRAAPELWTPPPWTHHLAGLLTLAAFVLVVAAYVPRNHLKSAIGNPMVAGVTLWALGHLLANGRAGDVLVFGGFFLWGMVDFISATRRDRAAGTVYPAGTPGGDARVFLIGAVAWALFAFYGHEWLIGMRPF